MYNLVKYLVKDGKMHLDMSDQITSSIVVTTEAGEDVYKRQAIEAADVVIMDDNPLKIATAIRIARRTVSIALQNAWFAIGIKVLVCLLYTSRCV